MDPCDAMSFLSMENVSASHMPLSLRDGIPGWVKTSGISIVEGMNFQIDYVFSRMRSKGSRFTLGSWGLRVCSLDVAPPSATVRNQSGLV